MRVKWAMVIPLTLAVTAIVGYRASTRPAVVVTSARLPRILLVADLSEADSADTCADIIRSVTAARDRGLKVQELNSDSKSELLRRYRVLTIPTVLILDDNGQVVSRFEGEDQSTVVALRTQLAQLSK